MQLRTEKQMFDRKTSDFTSHLNITIMNAEMAKQADETLPNLMSMGFTFQEQDNVEIISKVSDIGLQIAK